MGFIKRSSIVRSTKSITAHCWLCGKKKKCHHHDSSVNGHLCENCWQDALDIDTLLGNPIFQMRHPEPNEFTPHFPPHYR